jgi:DNA polymerase
VTSVRDQLRRYLEQRKELGESELILDRMTVDEVMRIVGAWQDKSDAEVPAAEVAADWRAALQAAGAGPESAAKDVRIPASGRPPQPSPVEKPRANPPRHELVAPGSSPAPAPPRPLSEVPAGISIGSAAHDLFEGGVKPKSLDEIAATVAKCTRCALYKTATNPVPGEGSATAQLVCVGEAPGANEDATGRPFVGQAGQLLTKILSAIDLRREDVFICNVLKHRPPENRAPAPDEVTACRPYLAQQLDLIRPKVIIAFGTFAAQTLLDTRLGIGKLREQIHRYYGIPLIVTYHPAALLRNPAWKRPTWEDVQLARRILDDRQQRV